MPDLLFENVTDPVFNHSAQVMLCTAQLALCLIALPGAATW